MKNEPNNSEQQPAECGFMRKVRTVLNKFKLVIRCAPTDTKQM